MINLRLVFFNDMESVSNRLFDWGDEGPEGSCKEEVQEISFVVR